MNTASSTFINANVITMDPELPKAQAVAIRGSRILLVGDNDGVRSITDDETRVIDCEGKSLVPGFIDAHCHVTAFAKEKLSNNISPTSAKTIQDIKNIIMQWAKSKKSKEWFIGTNYDEFHLSEKRHPTRWDIDEVSGNHPVVLFHRSYHACVLNSVALGNVGITTETPEPPGGQIDRDILTGEPNGILYNMIPQVIQEMPQLPESLISTALHEANREYLAHGITSLHDASPSNNLHRWNCFRRWKEEGLLQPRVYMMFGVDELALFMEKGFTPGFGDEELRLGSAKVMLNETNIGLPATIEELQKKVLEASQNGFQIAIHAIESVAVEAAIAALERAQSVIPIDTLRHRIEHCAECPPALVERLIRLPVAIVTQPSFIYFSGDRYLASVPDSWTAWLYRNRSLQSRGVRIASSSDSPVTSINPFIGMYAAVTRRARTGQIITAEEQVSPMEALAMYTINGAYVSNEENIKGSIKEGKLADMVLLSGDPLEPPPERLKEMKVERTILGGEIVWGYNPN